MTYTKSTTIYDQNGWLLISHGNGAAYTLAHFDRNACKRSVFLQGDDAIQFHNELEATRDNWPYEAVFDQYTEVMTDD